MSLAGFKKQINKANQFVSEKIGGIKGTELDEEFVDMEKKTDAMSHLVDEMMTKTHELLQPNPASRAKMLAVKSMSKLRGTSSHMLYPQPEGQLGECMTKYGKDLGEDSYFGQALFECGETYKQLAEIKYLMEDAVKQNFTEPLNHLQNNDLKEINFHRKKMQGRRLDFDCKKRKQGPGVEEEIRAAEEKFEESKQLTEVAMHNFFENEVEHIMLLQSFIDAELAYHKQSSDVLESLLDSLKKKHGECMSKPKTLRQPKVPTHLSGSGLTTPNHEFTPNSTTQNKLPGGPCCEALYEFEAENEGELAFREGDIIQLLSRIDENWLEGRHRGKVGYFPVTYVKILVDLH